MLIEKEIDNVVQQIAERLQPQEIIVFGSYAKGKAKAKSDLDVCVIKETELPMASRRSELGPLLCHPLVGLDVHIYTPEEVAVLSQDPLSFVGSILKTGKTVFKRPSNGSERRIS